MQEHLENHCVMVNLTCLFCKESFLRGSQHDCSVQKVAFQVYELNLQLNTELTEQVKSLSRANEKILASEENLLHKVQQLSENIKRKNLAVEKLDTKLHRQMMQMEKCNGFEEKIAQ